MADVRDILEIEGSPQTPTSKNTIIHGSKQVCPSPFICVKRGGGWGCYYITQTKLNNILRILNITIQIENSLDNRDSFPDKFSNN